ncbi:alkaline phosphatase D family protein [Acinetobacter rudis]|uniref:Alkaline phosphatase D n=1 Tax=Acinetobacter rudis CIP 110305 TaxID=421052 RepID=S3P0T6_9GAMM|nr:alkaline phosphatase D family protein [Acinetobacter rudis]EPF80019.1 alkaline phosphatase D [Acinetobacter rudis CIP 110305]
MSLKLSRRELIQKTIASFGILSVPVALTACGSDDDTPATVQAYFLHGVASGDPLHDRVILWTRLTPNDLSARLEVRWEIASDEHFKQIINTGSVETHQAQDFCVKVDADRLQAGQRYFYRFRFADQTSVIGQTKTLPQQTQAVNFAVCSCSNYPAGYFHVYREMAKHDLDAVIHLGDYIYEYGQGGYATENAEKLGRAFTPDNNKEIITLDDYRKRYAHYRTDLDLQLLHQGHPFIVIWDDHELANDAWREGAENHQENEGSFVERKLAALQAYFEWMPIRPSAPKQYFNIYRQFEFGNLVNLMMLDTRILDRDQQLEYKNYINAQGMDFVRFQKDLTDTKRKMIGITQRDWLQKKLMHSTATWQIIGQQVLMAKMRIPVELLIPLAKIMDGSAQPEDLAGIFEQVKALLVLKMRLLQGDPSLTEQEKARVLTVAPYNLDAWDGYFAEREMIFQMIKDLNKKVIVLAGDTHNAWSAKLTTEDLQQVGVEIAVSSVSSPGIEYYLDVQESDSIQQLQQAFTLLVDDLNYCNLSQRGYMLLNITEQRLDSQWIYVATVQDKNYKLDTATSTKIALTPTLETLKL